MRARGRITTVALGHQNGASNGVPAYNGHSTTTTVVNSAQPLFTSAKTLSSQNLPYAVQPTKNSVVPAYQSQVALNGHLAENRIHAAVSQSSQFFNAEMEELRAEIERTRCVNLS